MFERIIIVLILYTVLLSFDYSRLKKSEKKVTYIYLFLIVISLFLSTDYILDANWPNLKDLVRAVFLKPAEQIVEYMTIE
ncbi:hypothetical protein [Halalkalibacter alkaliphilus]|uniref:Uncharacterized protein n=1 Tax=Halalkalibacter alkaliphilus TaxID=2917993 RepID=A0A9X2CU23_9BACI|nr:hypothetical protein [Halalkalibacter alkaliphilus]MCL7748316.1 hypothetical protein [Halalkalibacter alkaliphilus]